MPLQWNKVQQQKPAVFDWLVLTISLLLSLLFPRLGKLVHASWFSAAALVALLMYVAGLWLKHRPVYERLARNGQPATVPYVLFLLIGHWVIMLVLVLVAENAARQLLGIPAVNDNAPASGWRIFWMIVLSMLLTWFAYRPGKKNYKVLPPKRLFWLELVGDLLLLSAVTMFSFVFWESSLLAAMSRMKTDSIGNIILLFLFLSFAYMLFYLPLRYLYLLEDNRGQAWRRLLLIFVLILLRGLLEPMLG